MKEKEEDLECSSSAASHHAVSGQQNRVPRVRDAGKPRRKWKKAAGGCDVIFRHSSGTDLAEALNLRLSIRFPGVVLNLGRMANLNVSGLQHLSDHSLSWARDLANP